MKIYNSPYTEFFNGVQLMIMEDPSDDSWEVYYRIAGSPFVFAFCVPKRPYKGFSYVIQLARTSVDDYVEVLFK